jgi:hypothetical protein
MERKMWDDKKQQQFDTLRQREAEGLLTEAERQILQALLTELDSKEAIALRPAIERMRARQEELTVEKERVEQENERLAAIVAKQERLLGEARDYLDQIRAQRATISEEYRAVTGRELSPSV